MSFKSSSSSLLFPGLLAATSVLGIAIWLTRKPALPAPAERPLRYPNFVDAAAISPLQGLRFANNSCHIDSLLFAILAFPENPMAQVLLDKSYDAMPKDSPCTFRNRRQIRKELQRITKVMHSNQPPTTCGTLRNLFGKCRNLRESVGDIDVPGVLQDPKDNLMLFVKVFPLEASSAMTTTSIRKKLNPEPNEPPSAALTRTTQACVFTIHANDVKPLENKKLSQAFSSGEYPIDDGKTEVGTMTYTFRTNFLVIDVQRRKSLRSTRALKTRIIPDQILPLESVSSESGRPLELQSVVAYAGSPHYVAFAKDPSSGIWYYYNDIGNPPIESVGSYENLLAFQNQLIQNMGVLFFYW